MSYGFVQLAQASTDSTSGNTASTPNFGVANTVANLIFAAAMYDDGGASGSPSFAIADTRGNTYSPIVTVDAGGGRIGAIFYAKNIAAGSNAVVLTVGGTPGSSYYKGILAAEYSGLDTVAPFTAGEFAGQAQSSVGAGTGAVTSGNTPAIAHQPAVIIGLSSILHSTSGPPNADTGAGFTSRGQFWQFATGTNFACLEDKRVTTLAAFAATFTASGGAGNDWASFAVVFKEAAGGGSGGPPPRPMSGGFTTMSGGMRG
jgi:hypothetical protein